MLKVTCFSFNIISVGNRLTHPEIRERVMRTDKDRIQHRWQLFSKVSVPELLREQ